MASHISGESPYGSDDEWDVEEAFIPYSLCSLIENPSFAVEVDPYYVVKNNEYGLIGSCNGLICFAGVSITREYYEYWFRLWNPATRKTSPNFGFFSIVPTALPLLMMAITNSTLVVMITLELIR